MFKNFYVNAGCLSFRKKPMMIVTPWMSEKIISMTLLFLLTFSTFFHSCINFINISLISWEFFPNFTKTYVDSLLHHISNIQYQQETNKGITKKLYFSLYAWISVLTVTGVSGGIFPKEQPVNMTKHHPKVTPVTQIVSLLNRLSKSLLNNYCVKLCILIIFWVIYFIIDWENDFSSWRITRRVCLGNLWPAGIASIFSFWGYGKSLLNICDSNFTGNIFFFFLASIFFMLMKIIF